MLELVDPIKERHALLTQALSLGLQQLQLSMRFLGLLLQSLLLIVDREPIDLNRLLRVALLDGLEGSSPLVLLLELRNPRQQRFALRLLLPLLGAQGNQLLPSLEQTGPQLLSALPPFRLVVLRNSIPPTQFLLSSLELSTRLLQRGLKTLGVLSSAVEHAS